MKGLAGQVFILHSSGVVKDWTVRKADLGKRATCDEAVEIREVSYSRDRLSFDVEHLGFVVGAKTGCPQNVPNSGTLTITGVSAADLAAGFEPLLRNLFMTPEAYLASRGVSLNFPPAAEGDPIRFPRPPGFTEIKPLLQVTPDHSDEGRRARVSGAIRIEFVVGADGRVHSPKAMTNIGYGLEEQGLRILPLWRFEPARVDGKAVASVNTVQFSFSVR